MTNDLQEKLDAILLDKNTNLLPENLKKGVTLLGVEGDLEIDELDTSDATATASDMAIGKTAYVNGEKIEGTLYDSATAEGLNKIVTLTLDQFGYDEVYPSVMSVGHFNEDKIIRSGKTVLTNIDAELARANLGITPEKIVKGQSIMGVEGTAETGGTSTDVPVKLFETIDEMQADTDAKEGDLALVYKRTIVNSKEDSTFKSMIFPETVVLDSAMTSSKSVTLINSANEFSSRHSIRLTASAFTITEYANYTTVVEYASDDGLTYTRTSADSTYISDEALVKYNGTWDDNIGKFILVDSGELSGVYSGVTCPDTSKLKLAMLSDYILQNNILYLNDTNAVTLDTQKVKNVINKINTDNSIAVNNWSIYMVGEVLYVGYLMYTYNSVTAYSYIGDSCDGDYNVLTKGSNGGVTVSGTLKFRPYTVDLEAGTYAQQSDISSVTTRTYTYSSTYTGYIRSFELGNRTSTIYVYNVTDDTFERAYAYSMNMITNLDDTGIDGCTTKATFDLYPDGAKYEIAPTQFTNLDASALYPEQLVLAGNGIVESNGELFVANSTYEDYAAKVYAEAQAIYDAMEPIIATDDSKKGSLTNKLYTIPSKSDGTPLLDTSQLTTAKELFYNCADLVHIPLLDIKNVTTASYMFYKCSSLHTIPLLDTSNVTNMQYMFSGCSRLTTVPLLDTSKATTTQDMFSGCTNLVTIPLLNTSSSTIMSQMFRNCSNLTSVPLLDTSNTTDMHYMFSGCSDLVDVPVLNTSKVTTMEAMFNDCNNLSDDSLDNILAMCANSGITDTIYKYLGYDSVNSKFGIGLTKEQVNKCKTLSNYSALTAAGWTTGY